ncbi:MAG: hypothetical protein K8T20_11505 [Planctomycetes bacterium]|nr:hypothetical protein [Planctomycetota bacterium]
MHDPRFGLALYTLMLPGIPLLFFAVNWLLDRLDEAMERRRVTHPRPDE